MEKNKILENFNLLNNQNYIFGNKLKRHIKILMSTSSGTGENIIGFSKNKDFQYIDTNKILTTILGNKILINFIIMLFGISTGFFLIINLSIIIGNSKILLLFPILIIFLIYILFFHNLKFKGFGNFRVIYDKKNIYFIKK